MTFRNRIVELVFWVSAALIFVPRVALEVFELRLRQALDSQGWDQGWELRDINGTLIDEALDLPKDLRGIEKQFGRRAWVFSKTLPTEVLAGFDSPTIVLGRIGDSDRVSINQCRVGSTGLADGNRQEGWWWSALRVYPIPNECLTSLTEQTARVEIHVYKWGGPSYGIYGGPMGIGESNQVRRIATIIDWLRYTSLAVLGVAMLFVGIYYIFVFLLLSSRKYHGIFGLVALGIGTYAVMTSTLPFRVATDGHNMMRILVASAMFTASSILWFLYERFSAVSRWLLWASVLGGGIALSISLHQGSLDGVYGVYEIWHAFFLLTFVFAFGQFVRFWIAHRTRELWRYVFGFAVFLACALHDVYYTFSGGAQPYMITYGFVVFSTTVALALAKEYADAFLHVEVQVEGRTRDLADAIARLKHAEGVKDRFFANISHDLKSPITVAMAAIDDVRTMATEQARRFLDSAQGNLEKLLVMVRDILDLVRAEAGTLKLRWELAPIGKLLRQWTDLYVDPCRRKGIVLHRRLEGFDGLRVPLDVNKFHRIIDNLINNAIKFTDEGSVRVSLRTDARRMYVDVEDSGIGVPTGEMELIFDRYYQSSRTSLKEHGGTGIGLSFARELTALHNGSIAADKGELGGTRFVVALPLSQDVEVTGEFDVNGAELTKEMVLRGSLDVAYPPARPAQADPKKPSVLVAEDNPEVANIIAQSLAEDFNVHFSPNGLDAFERLEKETFDILLTDVVMPRMRGDELIGRLRTVDRLRDLPVVVLSSRSRDEDIIALLRTGANDYVTKPFRKEVLRARMKTQIQTQELRRRLISADKMTTLGLLASGLAHEIKNPLMAAISNMGGIQKMMARLDDLSSEDRALAEETLKFLAERKDKLIRALKGTSSSLDRISFIVNSMRGYSSGSRERTEINLAETVKEAVTILKSKRAKKLLEIGVFEDNPSKVLGYSSLIQAVVNVIDNAIDAVPDDGGRVTVRLKTEGDRAIVTVEDNGHGIPPDVLARVFDPFVTTKPANLGTGLGLYIVRDIVEMQHGGKASIFCPPGGGTVFRMEIPTEAPPLGRMEAPPFHGLSGGM